MRTSKKQSIDRIALEHFWRACAKYKRLFAMSWLVPVSSIGMGVIMPYFVGKIIGSLAQDNEGIVPLIIGLAITAIVTAGINFIAFRHYFKLQPYVAADLDNESLTMLLRRSTSFHNNRVSGKLISDVNEYSAGFMQLSNVFFIDILPFICVVSIGVVLVSLKAPLLGTVLLLMTALSIYTAIRFRTKMKPDRIKRKDAGKAMIAHISDTIINNQAVKSFGAERHELSTHEKLSEKLLKLRVSDWSKLAGDGAMRLTYLFLFEIIFVIVLAWEIHRDPSLLAIGVFAFSYTVMLSGRLFQIGAMMRQVEEALIQVAPMTEILQEKIEITDAPDAQTFVPSGGKIDFKSVTFRYSDASQNDTVFQDLNITINAGEKIGLVGSSGGGKSTLTKLLLRFEDITEGKLLIDGQNIKDVTQESLRRSISYVSQEPLLFHRSIYDNIAYGNFDATSDEIIEAAKKAYADEFIRALPSGYDTLVGERGVKLSGGQRQRIAIARAILKDAPILVLDEATSALDSESERFIQSALVELMKNKTAVVVAHRLSTIQKMDRILVLDHGSLIEAGSHGQLLKHDGQYAKLWKHQSGGFIEE